MIEKILIKILVPGFILFPLIPYLSESISSLNNEYEAWINYEKGESKLKFVAYCKNNTEKDAILLLKIIILKSGEKDKSVINQNIEVNMKKNETKRVATSTINLQKGERYSFLLELYKDEKLIQTRKGENE